MENNAAAIILCAGKGTRMNDDSRNKVTFDCAGISVIRRIVDNMKQGGVSRFVIVVGHKAESVMDALDGVEGVLYTYQKEQKGTGHAALIGLKALRFAGYSGPVILSMGDKIIAPRVIRGLLDKAGTAKAVWGVEPLADNPKGGRVIADRGKPYGVVEFADAALEALAGVRQEDYAERLEAIGLNRKKAEKVIKRAIEKKPTGWKTLCGRKFPAQELLCSSFANAAIYCLDAERAEEVVGSLGSDNAQGEIYLTDALEVFSKAGEAVLYEITSKEDMLTYSTREELGAMSHYFLKNATVYEMDIRAGRLDGYFEELYRNGAEKEKERYLRLLNRFIEAYGDSKVVIARSPGRVNLMGRHIDHRGGGINVMATDKDTVFVASRREDDFVRLTNTDAQYPDRAFSISGERGLSDCKEWLDYLNDEKVRSALEASAGDWSNYVKGAVLRAEMACGVRLCGMDMASDGTIPVAAGLSSSSSIVVAVLEAVKALNALNLSDDDFIRIAGEGEWFVGSRGGAGDQAAMKCGRKDKIIHLGFKPFTVGKATPFSDKYVVVVANSMIKAKKSEGSKDAFNARIAAYECAFMLLKKEYPGYDFRVFRDLSAVRPSSELYRMLKKLPVKATREALYALLPGEKSSLAAIFRSHADPGFYDLRGVALFGISECVRSERFMTLLEENDYSAIGRMMKISHDGDRVGACAITDAYLDHCAAEEVDPALVGGSYACSIPEIDELSDLLNETEGVLGSELAGAGLGGCVIALVEKEKAADVIAILNERYYDKRGLQHAANVFLASPGSCVLF